MRPKLRKALVGFVVLGVLAGLALFLLVGSAPKLPALPNPNGYDDFVKAGNLISASTVLPYDMEREVLREYVSTNAKSLRLLRVGLSRTSAVPAMESITNFAGRMSDLMVNKRLAQLLAGEGRLAEMEGRTNDAVQIYVEGVRFGNEISRGGFFIHRLVGIACEAISLQGLSKIASSVEGAAAERAVAELQKVDQAAVSWNETLSSEQLYMWHEMKQIKNPIRWVSGWWEAQGAKATVEAKHHEATARRRALLLELAVRRYRAEKGKPPASLEELVPNYLSQVPADPFSEKAFGYESTGTNWLFYSVGPDKVDDGGKIVDLGKSKERKGDLLFNSP